MGKFIASIVAGFGSKKITLAVAAGITWLMVLLLKAIGAKYGIEVSGDDLTKFGEVLAAIVVPVILALWHIDVKTEGKSTTAFAALAAAAAAAAPGLAPELGAVVGKLVEDPAVAAMRAELAQLRAQVATPTPPPPAPST